ncbi:MAG: DNA-directed polymerase [Cyanobacteria bacterium RYN_339]|nr:DNA-directed polymerase [Cyanobacteria bacterium RYN_339]
MTGARAILHVDMDAFFASVAQLDDPSLRGKPVIVGGHSLRRGVVSACSYETRVFGVHSGMPLFEALTRCPQAVLARVDMPRYREVHELLKEIWARHAPVVETASFDEAYLDLTGCDALLGPPEGVARAVQADIVASAGLPCSVGVGPNKLLAKVASKRAKPSGVCVVPEGQELAWLAPLPVGQIHGIGPKTVERLARFGLTQVAHLQAIPREELARFLGPGAEHLADLANGIDRRAVVGSGHAKSIGAERTFDADVQDAATLKAIIYDLVQEVAYRGRQARVLARTVTVKIRYQGFETLERERTLPQASDDDGTLAAMALTLLREYAEPGRPIRLLGVRLSNFHTVAQLNWLAPEEKDEHRRLNTALDKLRERHGLFIVSRATRLARP